MRARAAEAGIRHVHLFAFRDLDDPDRRRSRKSTRRRCAPILPSPGSTSRCTRVGSTARRQRSRATATEWCAVVAVSECSPPRRSTRSPGAWVPCDGLIEVFHGVPFFAPLWSRKPQIGLVHHVHLGTWDMLLPGPLGRVGEFFERHAVPIVYKRRALVAVAHCRHATRSSSTTAPIHRGSQSRTTVSIHGSLPAGNDGPVRWYSPSRA